MDAKTDDRNAGCSRWLAGPLLPSLLACFACTAPALPMRAMPHASGLEPPIASMLSKHRPTPGHRACIRPAGFSNRLYRRSNNTLAYWQANAAWTRTLPPVPTNAVAFANGTIFHEGNLHVPWQTETGRGLARVVADDAGGYRLRLEDGTTGPRVARQADGRWELANTEDNFVNGSVLAHVVAEQVTSDPRTLHRAAGLLESMGLRESELIESRTMPILPDLRQSFQATTTLAVGQSFVETLPARLRDPAATVWTPNEVRIIAPDLARHIAKPLAIYGSNGRLDIAVHSDGTPISPESVPANAVRVTYDDANRYGRFGRQPGEYPSIFAAVEADTRPTNVYRAVDASHQENLFRTELATAIEATSALPRLVRMHERWINPLQVPHLHKQKLRGFSRLRLALLDRNQPLGAGEEKVILLLLQDLLPADQRIAIEVVRHGSGQPGERLAFIHTPHTGTPVSAENKIVIEADLDGEGRRTAYYQRGAPGNGAIRSRPIADNSFSPIIDVLLNTDDGRIRKALGLGEWDFQTFADRIQAKGVEQESSLIPRSLQRLVVNDPAVLADAATRTTDSWSVNGHHYVRLRDLAGRTQVVETHAPADGGSREVLGYSNDPVGRLTGAHSLREHRGLWSPSGLLRRGFDPLSDAFRHDAAATIVAHLPGTIRMDMNTAIRIAGAIPYPNLMLFMKNPAPIEIAPNGEMMLVTDRPNPTRYRTRMDTSGQPVLPIPAVVAIPPRPATPLTRHQTLTPAPLLRATRPLPDASTIASSADIATLNSLLASGAPIGEFITRGVGSAHVQALVTTRRWRSMLREDEHMVFVGKAAGHVFSVAIPINATSIQLTQSGVAATSIAALPPGTRIIDDWYGVSASVADYPARVRAVAGQWDRDGFQITVPGGEGGTTSSSAFTEQVLSSPMDFSLWYPRNDPISETRYLDYIHDRYTNPRETVHAGLDWLDSPAARSEYARYFADDATERASVSSVDELARNAIDVAQAPAEASAPSNATRPTVIVSPGQSAPPGSP